ncbi:proton extrusion protein PcxA [Tolypothrix bouteillei]|uniref:Proton extrusion protein PxcA n=1 Tax=Tolypothrix bouteillei VB521301 TaxID=1479485 RepID=A0A0C1R815_9CYAN|nr:proton extrusion protein PcxA [Tolypothrix bouteillei]KAF3883755.1 proton extrusion protein PcxA [Tolypothrix bouteillei VB521301]
MKNYITPSKSDKFLNKINHFLHESNQWFFNTSERALEQAYQIALKIKNIELEHFGGDKVSTQGGEYSQNVLDCFQTDVEKYLNTIKIRIAEFKISRFFLKNSNYAFLEKLKLIDEVLTRYNEREVEISRSASEDSPQKSILSKLEYSQPLLKSSSQLSSSGIEPVTQKTGILPRSIGKTIRKITNDISRNSEEEVVRTFQASRKTTRLAINFLGLLILIPLLTQEVSKHFLILPAVEHFRSGESTSIFLNWEMKEEAFKQLQSFEEELKFERLLKHSPQISSEAIEEKVSVKVMEIAEEFKRKSNSAVANVFADLLGLVAFAGVVLTNKRGVAAVKTLLNEIVYGLSDSAKAFIIILFTDIFVGFHSPHGWEVILESIATHLGIPADRNAIFLFIATFPVILDTIFKYWVFRYLNQISPSAVATLKNMNE